MYQAISTSLRVSWYIQTVLVAATTVRTLRNNISYDGDEDRSRLLVASSKFDEKLLLFPRQPRVKCFSGLVARVFGFLSDMIGSSWSCTRRPVGVGLLVFIPSMLEKIASSAKYKQQPPRPSTSPTDSQPTPSRICKRTGTKPASSICTQVNTNRESIFSKSTKLSASYTRYTSSISMRWAALSVRGCFR